MMSLTVLSLLLLSVNHPESPMSATEDPVYSPVGNDTCESWSLQLVGPLVVCSE